jgi:hypothetical protein
MRAVPCKSRYFDKNAAFCPYPFGKMSGIFDEEENLKSCADKPSLLHTCP